MKSTSEILLIISTSARGVDDPLFHALDTVEQNLIFAESCREAYPIIRENEKVGVIVCEVSLPDGNWCDLIRQATVAQSAARIVVRTKDADERFWSEALWRGVYDLLVEPFSPEEARRVIEGAFRAHNYWSGPMPIPRPPGRETSTSEPVPRVARHLSVAGEIGRTEVRAAERNPADVKTRNRKIPAGREIGGDIAHRRQAAS